jgi:hypothetical protein
MDTKGDLFRVIQRLCILGVLIMGLAVLMTTRPVKASDSCGSCDLDNTRCLNSCNTQYPNGGTGYQSCTNTCYNTDSGCYNSCNAAYAGYHYYGDISGFSAAERNSCFRMAHRTAYNSCFAGEIFYPAAFNACIAESGDIPAKMQNCCEEQEIIHADAMLCPYY